MGMCGPSPFFASYTLAFALHLRKNQDKNLSQCRRKFQLGTIHCVDIATVWQVAIERLSILFPLGTLYAARVSTPPAYVYAELPN